MSYVARLTGAFRRFASAKHSVWDVPLVLVASLLLYAPFLGVVPVFDTDEANFAAASREMLWRGDYLRVTIGLQPFFDKPPLFFWLQAVSMRLFGVTEWAARIPNAVIGGITYVLLFRIGARIWDRRFAYFWVLVYSGSVLPSAYFRSGIIDPLFNLFMFSAIWSIVQCQDDAETTGGQSGNLRAFAAGVFSGLAVLTKGPLGYGIPVLCWFLFWALFRRSFPGPLKHVAIFTVTAAIIGSSWFGLEYLVNGPEFLTTFTTYQVRLLLTGQGHGHPVYYHFVTTFVGCFPMSVVALWSLGRHANASLPRQNLNRWMALIFWSVMILFSLVTTKILHYVSLAYIPLAYFAAVTLYTFGQGRRASTLYSVVLITAASCWALVAIVAPIVMLWRGEWASLINDSFARSNVLAPVGWTLFDVLPGVLFLVGLAAALVHLRRQRALLAHVWLFASWVAAAIVAVVLLLPKIHEHTQGALLRFIHLARSEHTTATTTFLSYVRYFYSDLHVVRDVLDGKHAPRYVIGRLGDAHSPQPPLTKLREENGYVLFRVNGRSGADGSSCRACEPEEGAGASEAQQGLVRH